MEKKILIVNVNWVGDVLFTTPFIRAVCDAYPESYVACLIHPRCVEMLDGNPRLNDIIIYDEEGEHKTLIGKIKLIAYLRKKKFNTAFILHRSFTKALITMLAGIRERIGYATKNRAFLLTKAVEEPAEDVHRVEYFLNIASAIGLEIKNKSYEFFVSDSDRLFIKEFLRRNDLNENDLLVAICPGGNWDPKRWPKENFARLANSLIERFNARIVISGAKKDIGLAKEIAGMMKDCPIIACGETTLKQVGALLERSNLVIANDTGPMHIAVSMKTKVIALFGPTSPHITGPYGEGNYRVIYKTEGCEVPCYDMTCNDNSCMAAISVEDVLSAVNDML